MQSGVRFNALERGEVLINESINWSYNNLNGIYAANAKLNDEFKYASDIGFNIVYDKVTPVYVNNQLTIKNIGSNGDVWPIFDGPVINNYQYDRISVYKENCYNYKFKFILEVEFYDTLTRENLNDYLTFFNNLFKNTQFNWIMNFQISEYPEQLIKKNINGTIQYVDKIDPVLYTLFISKLRSLAKNINPNINIGGPGLFKGCSYFNNSNFVDNSFNINWIKVAMDNGLLNYLDFFSTQLIQSSNLLQYDNIQPITTNLKNEMMERINTILPIYSFNQGFQISTTNNDDYILQSYYNTSELLNSSKNNVIPIIDKLVDPCNNTNINPNYNPNIEPFGYGILNFDLSKNYQYDILKYVLYNLKNYNILDTPNKLYSGDYADDITYISDDKKTLISVLYNKKNVNSVIDIFPNVNEKVILKNGDIKTVNSVYEFDINYDFIIVIQDLTYLQVVDIKDTLFKKFLYWSNYRDDLLNSIPLGYNTKIDDINFYQLIRAISYEFADSNILVDIIKDNTYLKSAHDTAIYNNFGSLVGLEKKARWDYEKYRKLIQGVIKSLLSGPTLNSITEAMNLFINYDNIINDAPKIVDITIHELYKQDDPFFNSSMIDFNGVYPDFAFIVEVDKNLNVNADMSEINEDLKFLINILKPARCISFVVVVLQGDENYRDWYKETHFDANGNMIDFKDSDILYEMSAEIGNLNTTDYYGWKHFSYNGIFNTFSNTKQNSLLNSTNVIAPKKSNHIKKVSNNITNLSENIEKPELENPNLIRYGYYNDDKDGNEIKHDNQNLDKNSPDYLNLDSGEYYQNWWVKFHKIIEDNNNKKVNFSYLNTTTNMEDNKSYLYNLNNEFNKNVIEEQYTIDKNTKIVNPPMFFTLSGNKLNSVFISKKPKEFMTRNQYEIENSNFNKEPNYYYSHIGTSSILHPEIYFEKGYKEYQNNIFQLNKDILNNQDNKTGIGYIYKHLKNKDVTNELISNFEIMKQIFFDCSEYEIKLLQQRLLLPYELRVYNYQNIINDDGTLNDDNGLHNKLYLINSNPYNNKNFAFSDIDQMPNFKIDINEPQNVNINYNIFQLNKDLMFYDINKIINTLGVRSKITDTFYRQSLTNFLDIDTKNIQDDIINDIELQPNEYNDIYDTTGIINNFKTDNINNKNDIFNTKNINDIIGFDNDNNKNDIYNIKNINDTSNMDNNDNESEIYNTQNDNKYSVFNTNKNDIFNTKNINDIINMNNNNNKSDVYNIKNINDISNIDNDNNENESYKIKNINDSSNNINNKNDIYNTKNINDIINNNINNSNTDIINIINDLLSNKIFNSNINDSCGRVKEIINNEIINNINETYNTKNIQDITSFAKQGNKYTDSLKTKYNIFQLNNDILSSNINNINNTLGLRQMGDELNIEMFKIINGEKVIIQSQRNL